jgi:hypothetical protein
MYVMNKSLNAWFLLLMLFLCSDFAVAQDSSPRRVEVTIHCTSRPGVPVPVMTLERSEAEEYRRLLGQFVTVREDEEERQPIVSFYRGLTIREYTPDNTSVSDLRLYGKRIVGDPQPDEHGVGRWRSRQLAPDDSLELYLLNLAHDKGVIDEEIYQVIHTFIRERK